MFPSVYVEASIKHSPIAEKICQKRTPIYCERYTEVFNKQNQNFRLQKENPSLILAKKTGNLVLETPKEYSIGSDTNFYFSHLLNCPFDCRYCFLQGMYSSANFVLFCNYEDFQTAILEKIMAHTGKECHFFSGYDGDSLALESVTQFLHHFLPFFRKTPQALFEIRTKSTNISPLLATEAIQNCVVAYSLMPSAISKNIEHKTPSIACRLDAIKKVQAKGWKIGLRFDPLIYCDHFESLYQDFFAEVFQAVNLSLLHSVTIGAFRLPRNIYKNMADLYPEETLFAHSLSQKDKLVSYKEDVENKLLQMCYNELLRYIPKNILFAYGVK